MGEQRRKMISTTPFEFHVELCDCERVLLEEIACKCSTRKSVAKTYHLAIKSSERNTINWKKVNEAIIARWSPHALNWIKEQAWSGKAFT